MQSELHPLEEGKHAAESGMDLKAYAERAGKDRSTLARKVMAWRVLAVCHVAHTEACSPARVGAPLPPISLNSGAIRTLRRPFPAFVIPILTKLAPVI